MLKIIYNSIYILTLQVEFSQIMVKHQEEEEEEHQEEEEDQEEGEEEEHRQKRSIKKKKRSIKSLSGTLINSPP